jgi:hypothetical protein
MTWLFSLDDQNDEGSYGRNPEARERALTDVFLAAVKPDGQVTKNPLSAALTTIFDRIGDRMSVGWRHRFLHHVFATTLNFVGMLRAWMRGRVEWGRNTARYLEAMS